MARYLVETNHTARECTWALKQALRGDTAFLDRFEWGCRDGDHRGWAIVDAEDRFAAQAMVPRLLRPYTRIVELTPFSPKEALAYHEALWTDHPRPRVLSLS
jgi:hypothetical protein